ncbi:Putative zinc-or iron-chelating domain-containing protein [Maridesulfovibrio ferrireducens]|uniref:Putative zinc-or iron-chelating domain-containing protein n=1 Tax=Maridesulfovibrio ferrireducens TaxID=246191 RepID=A0A1G9GWH0_9BACT|nr:YkgJ family cysteine cluster protein [Maridesulfovibrio ferrireducens]SDL05050.1 Putative zinc-or iron-chelating domain-containing protein [Maridesulfovibrio ferrireducens]
MDFTNIFEKYEALVAEVDKAFKTVSEQTDDGIKCGKGCSDCCHALFDLTLVEAIYLNRKFNETFRGMKRSTVMQRSDVADRSIHKIKRRAFKASQTGTSAQEIIKEISLARVRCPLLGDDDLCELYDFRPLTCRIYGVPMNIGGEAHSCTKSGFSSGKSYPTINMDILQTKLVALSTELTESINSKLKSLPEMIVPVSMALVTDYTPEYLGENTGNAKEEVEIPVAAPSEACSTCSEDKSACANCNYTVSLGDAPEAE